MLKVALVGNPNSGKTTLFNALTGSSARVGNWPGVTIDKRTGQYKKLGEVIEIIDLPGLYSFNPYTMEEKIARDFIIEQHPDVIINIVDATNIERNLYLTTQLLEMDVPLVVALNFIDVIEKDDIYLDITKLSNALGVTVIPISALKNKSIKELMVHVKAQKENPRTSQSVLTKTSLGTSLFDIKQALRETGETTHLDYHAVKLLEGDQVELDHYPQLVSAIKTLITKIPPDIFKGDFAGKIADLRYQYITNLVKDILVVKPLKPRLGQTADRIMTHKIWGIPLFALVMFFVFHLTFSEDFLFLNALHLIPNNSFSIPIIGESAINSPGVMIYSAFELLIEVIEKGLISLTSSAVPWISSLVVEGIWAGVGAVLSFLPQIVVLFIFISILEDSGYMARVAFMLDRLTRKFGLSGRAFLPLLMSFGCTVPAIMATRTLRNEKERRLTILLSPFFSCGAKLPIWLVFGAYLYQGNYSDLVVTSIYLIGIIVALIVGYIANRFFIKSHASPFIMEMPEYRFPKWLNVFSRAWEKIKDYMINAATIIAASTIIIWFLTSFSFSFTMVTNTKESIIGVISTWIAPLFIPLGFGGGQNGWMFVVASFTGLIAKEMVPSTLGTIAQVSGTNIGAIITSLGPAAAFGFMTFNLLTIPCMATVSAAKAELKSLKQLLITISLWVVISLVMGSLVYLSLAFMIARIIIGGLILLILIYMISEFIYKRKKVSIQT